MPTSARGSWRKSPEGERSAADMMTCTANGAAVRPPAARWCRTARAFPCVSTDSRAGSAGLRCSSHWWASASTATPILTQALGERRCGLPVRPACRTALLPGKFYVQVEDTRPGAGTAGGVVSRSRFTHPRGADHRLRRQDHHQGDDRLGAVPAMSVPSRPRPTTTTTSARHRPCCA